MLHEDLVVRNIDVLKSLGEGGSLTIDGLVDSMSGRYKRGNVELSLRILEDQGLVREDEDRYSLADGGKVNEMLSVVGGWVSYFDSSFIGVARDTARIIFEKAWEDACVEDVMLYGSTLNGEDPRDIDMVLLHSGYVLKEFSRYASSKMYDVEPETEADARISSWCIFNQLGYRVDESDSVTKAVGKLIEGLGAGTVTDEEIDEKRREHEECWKPNHRFGEDEEELDLMEGAPEFDAEFDLDIHGISKVFDIHVLNTDLLRNPEDEVLREGVQGRRQGVIDSCGDLTYWYTVLSEGRLYDKRTHDFSILVEDKYPGALELFPSER